VSLDKNHVKRLVEKIENSNGTKLKDFSVKEVLLILNDDLKNTVHEINMKVGKLSGYIGDHDIAIQKISDNLKYVTEELPEKGWCGKVENALFPPKQLTLSSMVLTLWHDRRWMKYIATALVAIVSIEVINIFI